MMVKQVERGFEFVARVRHETDLFLQLPSRKTTFSAGYDFFLPKQTCFEPGQSYKIRTGIKAFMLPDEYLALYIRSSLAIKHNLILKNCTGIIDSDYYNNPDNEGEIIVCIENIGDRALLLDAGSAFAQGIFCKYMIASNDANISERAVRTGGIGSTTEK